MPHWDYHSKILDRLTPLLAPFASVQLHHCMIAARQGILMKEMADRWGVPVSAAPDVQYGGGTRILPTGEKTSSTFTWEGKVATAYPGKITNVQGWAEHVKARVPEHTWRLWTVRIQKAVATRLPKR